MSLAQAMVLLTLLVIWTEPGTLDRAGLQDSCGNLVVTVKWVNDYCLYISFWGCYQKIM